jgi:hypothetical protein
MVQSVSSAISFRELVPLLAAIPLAIAVAINGDEWSAALTLGLLLLTGFLVVGLLIAMNLEQLGPKDSGTSELEVAEKLSEARDRVLEELSELQDSIQALLPERLQWPEQTISATVGGKQHEFKIARHREHLAELIGSGYVSLREEDDALTLVRTTLWESLRRRGQQPLFSPAEQLQTYAEGLPEFEERMNAFALYVLLDRAATLSTLSEMYELWEAASSEIRTSVGEGRPPSSEPSE